MLDYALLEDREAVMSPHINQMHVGASMHNSTAHDKVLSTRMNPMEGTSLPLLARLNSESIFRNFVF